MRNICTNLFVLFIAFVFAVSAQAQRQSSTLENSVNSVAELGFRIGPETNTIVGGDINNRTWVDKKNIIVPGSDSRSYLVRFRQRCQGTGSGRMISRIIKIKGNVSQYDTFSVRYRTRDLALCEIRWIYELEPI